MKWFRNHWFDIVLAMAVAAVTYFGFKAGGPVSGPPADVVILRLDGEVEQALAGFIEQGIAEAEHDHARAVLIEIATFGGNVDAMSDIGDIMTTARVPVYTFVRGKALSAGAFLALSGRKVIMTPEAVMGASEPRTADNRRVTDRKTMAAMRGMFRALAEARRDRGVAIDPTIAEAMVDAAIEVDTPGVKAPGQLVVLTGTEANRLGYCDGLASTREEALRALDFGPGTTARVLQPSPAQKFGRVLSSGLVSTLLIIAGILGILIEVITPGFGLPGTIGIVSLTLFFGSRVMGSMAGWEVVALFILGLMLLGLEALAPGFGVLGISGLVSLSASIILAYPSRTAGAWSLGIAALWLLFLGRIAVRVLGATGVWNHLVLREGQPGKPEAVSPSPLLGREGVALTVLRPAGMVEIDDERVDAVSEGSYIAAGSSVRVVQVQGNRVVVRPLRIE